jgi:hypothetical protein
MTLSDVAQVECPLTVCGPCDFEHRHNWDTGRERSAPLPGDSATGEAVTASFKRGLPITGQHAGRLRVGAGWLVSR